MKTIKNEGYRIPDPEGFRVPETNKEKIRLGDNGMTESPGGQRIHNIVAAIHNRMAEGLAPFVFITGQSQTGKTWTALRIAYELHEVTNAAHGEFGEKNILYQEEQALNSMTIGFDEEKDRPALKQVLIGDELGEQANANSHNSTENRAWKMILNVMPLLKNCIIGIDPKSDRVDRKIRDSPNYRIYMADVGRCRGQGRTYRGVDQKGKDKWDIDYFSSWSVPKPPERYLDLWKPQELRYKLSRPIEYLEKLKDEKDEAPSLSEL